MLMTPERRHSERARIPCHIPVELTDAARAAQFEADAVDLSVGGLSLRAAQLPSIGSQLFCTFEAMPGGAQILGRGEVVWSQPTGNGDNGGEFGLRFIEVDARNQALIDEMVAERIARITPREKPAEPVLATLEIENYHEPLTARLVHAGDTHALFEQPLSHFAVGKAVIAHAGASLVRGHVASIEVRMEGTTPRLLINLEVAREASHFGEFMWGEPGSDTDPDVFAQTQANADQAETAEPQQASAEEDDELEDEDESDEDFDEEDDEEEEGDEEEEDDEEVPPALELHEEEAAKSGTLAGLGAPLTLPAPILARKEPDAQQLPLFRRENQRATTPEAGGVHLRSDETKSDRPSFAPDDVYMDEQRAKQLIATEQPPAPYDDDASLEEVHAVSLAASQQYAAGDHNEDDTETVPTDGPLMRVLGVFARVTEGVERGKERAREWATGIREDASSRVGGSGRLFGPKPRRVTSSIQREGDPGKHNLRVIAIGSMCILALVAFAYALTPSSEEPLPHHDVRGDQVVDPGLEAETETTEDSTLAATSGEAPAAALRAEQAPAEKPMPARAAAPRNDRVEQLPAEKRSANPASLAAKPTSTLAAKAPPPPAATPSSAAAGGSMSFGAKQVPNARRFLLRMSEPVKTILGKENVDGFSVVIMGNTALDKAAPIAAGHPGVAHAAILNRRGDHSAELNVQFSPGKTPAYRVSGQGSTLEVLIEQ